MRKTEELYLGDKVKTKKSFKQKLPNGDIYNNEGRIFEGIVIGKRGEYVEVDLGEELPFTHYCNNKLQNKTGVAISKKFLEIVEPLDIEDKQLKTFVGLMKESFYSLLQEIPREARTTEDTMVNITHSINELLSTLKMKEKKLQELEYKLVEINGKKSFYNFNQDSVIKMYNAMLKNTSINSLDVVDINNDKCLLVTTNDLIYSRPSSDIEDYSLGAYKIAIPLNATKAIRCINYKKHIHKFKYHHPCVKEGLMCLGSAMGEEVKALRETSNLIPLVHLLINFLKRPNYGTPHIGDLEFSCAQKVTIKPRDVSSWFIHDYWIDNEVFDATQYSRDLEAANKRLVDARRDALQNQPRSSNEDDEQDGEAEDVIECDNCGYFYNDQEEACPECGHIN